MELLLDDNITIYEAVQSHVANETDRDALDSLIHLIESTLSHSDRCAATVSAAWQLILTRRLWRSRYSSLQKFQLVLNYDQLIYPVIRCQSRNEHRIERTRCQLSGNWPGFGKNIFSQKLGRPLLEGLF
jgi:hypothetical protein